MEFLWIFLILVALQPVIRQKLLEASRRRLLTRIEAERGSRVILLVHRQETMSFLGFPVLRYIDVEDSEAVLRAVDLTDREVPIDVVLHTPGGLALAALQIARALHDHPGKVTVFVPHYAMSGGTLIALAADEIVMSRHAVLGPVDPHLGTFPAASVLAAVRRKPIERIDDQTLILADQAEKAMVQVTAAVEDLLAKKMDGGRAKDVAKLLGAGRFTHDHGIPPDEARQLGLPVTDGIPRGFLDLMKLYPQPMRRQSGVEYVPGPHRAPSERKP